MQNKPREYFINDEIQLKGFEDWYTEVTLMPGSTAMIRHVLFLTKKELRESWLYVRPMNEPEESEQTNDPG